MIEENTTIELATHSDASEIAMLSRDLIEQGLSWSWNTERVKKAMRDRSTNVVVARDRSNLAGFGIMKYGYKHANLNLLAVKNSETLVNSHQMIILQFWLSPIMCFRFNSWHCS